MRTLLNIIIGLILATGLAFGDAYKLIGIGDLNNNKRTPNRIENFQKAPKDHKQILYIKQSDNKRFLYISLYENGKRIINYSLKFYAEYENGSIQYSNGKALITIEAHGYLTYALWSNIDPATNKIYDIAYLKKISQ